MTARSNIAILNEQPAIKLNSVIDDNSIPDYIYITKNKKLFNFNTSKPLNEFPKFPGVTVVYLPDDKCLIKETINSLLEKSIGFIEFCNTDFTEYPQTVEIDGTHLIQLHLVCDNPRNLPHSIYVTKELCLYQLAGNTFTEINARDGIYELGGCKISVSLLSARVYKNELFKKHFSLVEEISPVHICLEVIAEDIQGISLSQLFPGVSSKYYLDVSFTGILYAKSTDELYTLDKFDHPAFGKNCFYVENKIITEAELLETVKKFDLENRFHVISYLESETGTMQLQNSVEVLPLSKVLNDRVSGLESYYVDKDANLWKEYLRINSYIGGFKKLEIVTDKIETHLGDYIFSNGKINKNILLSVLKHASPFHIKYFKLSELLSKGMIQDFVYYDKQGNVYAQDNNSTYQLIQPDEEGLCYVGYNTWVSSDEILSAINGIIIEEINGRKIIQLNKLPSCSDVHSSFYVDARARVWQFNRKTKNLSECSLYERELGNGYKLGKGLFVYQQTIHLDSKQVFSDTVEYSIALQYGEEIIDLESVDSRVKPFYSYNEILEYIKTLKKMFPHNKFIVLRNGKPA